MSAISGQKQARMIIATIEVMHNDTYADSFLKSVKKLGEKHTIVNNPWLQRKRKMPNYSVLQYVDGHKYNNDLYYAATV